MWSRGPARVRGGTRGRGARWHRLTKLNGLDCDDDPGGGRIQVHVVHDAGDLPLSRCTVDDDSDPVTTCGRQQVAHVDHAVQLVAQRTLRATPAAALSAVDRLLVRIVVLGFKDPEPPRLGPL